MFFKNSGYKTLTELVKGCQKQERRAQALFFDRYKGKMLGVCARYARTVSEGEDILQEAFIKVFQHIGNLKEPELADRWVKKIVIHTAISYYHRTTVKSENLVNLDKLDSQLEASDSLEVLHQLDMEVLLRVINQLPDGYRAVINLYLIDGYTHAEIGEILQIDEPTSKSQLSRGKKLLIRNLQSQGIISA